MKSPHFRYFLPVACALGMALHPARALTRTVAAGDWNTGSEWSGGAVPLIGDNADVNGGRSVNITTTGGPFAANDVNVGNSGTGVINHSGNTLNNNFWAFVGRGGNAGTYNLSGTGSFSSSNTGDANGARIYVGVDGGSNGYYNQSGGTTFQRLVYIGETGRGTLNLSGGSFTTTSEFRVGNSSGTGVVNHSGGTLAPNSTWAAVGGTSKATLNFTGGTANLGQLRLGNSSGSAEGTMIVNGGTVTSTYNESGWSAVARNQMTAGTYTNNGTLTLGPVSGNGTFTVTGGVFNQNGQIRLGSAHGQGGNTLSQGTLNISGGVVNAAGQELNAGFRDGGAGSARGTVNISGGVSTFGATILGRDTGSTGVANVSAGQVNFGNTTAGDSGGGAGTFNISGGNVGFGYINVGNNASSPGVMNQSGGTVSTSSWLGIATQANGVGTWNASGGVLNAGNMEIGPRAGSDGVLNVSGTAQVNADGFLFSHHAPGGSARSQINLEGGTARVDNVYMTETATDFNWGSGVLTLKTASGTQGTADLSLGTSNSPLVSYGRQMTFTQVSPSGAGTYGGVGADETIATGSGINITGTDSANASTLNLGGLYLSAGVRYNKAVFNDGMRLNASASGDILKMDSAGLTDTVYLLRPFGFFTEDYGSLPLIEFNGGGSMTGTFDTFVGLADDGKGFSMSTFAVTTATANTLAVNTWYLEQTSSGVFFHYKVAGAVPEPDSFALLALSVVGLRTARTLRERRKRVTVAA